MKNRVKKIRRLDDCLYPLELVIMLLMIALVIPLFITIFQHGHAISDDLYEELVYPTCTDFWWKWTSGKQSLD
jgi:hypothetical protein